jgi:acyl-CoA thioesterase FadM
VGFAILYLVTDAETEKEIARAQTGMVFFDYQARRLHRMPAEFRRCLEDV